MLAPNYPMLLCSYYWQEHSYLPLSLAYHLLWNLHPMLLNLQKQHWHFYLSLLHMNYLHLYLHPLQQHEFE